MGGRRAIASPTPPLLTPLKITLHIQMEEEFKRNSWCFRANRIEFLNIPHFLPNLESTYQIEFVTESRLDDRIEAASHRSIVGFVCKEPFLFESAHALQVSHTGLPDIVTQGTLQCFY